ncbi:MAG: hypothetical protein ACLQDC_03730 [Verrucomicrobiia bacterium]
MNFSLVVKIIQGRRNCPNSCPIWSDHNWVEVEIVTVERSANVRAADALLPAEDHAGNSKEIAEAHNRINMPDCFRRVLSNNQHAGVPLISQLVGEILDQTPSELIRCDNLPNTRIGMWCDGHVLRIKWLFAGQVVQDVTQQPLFCGDGWGADLVALSLTSSFRSLIAGKEGLDDLHGFEADGNDAFEQVQDVLRVVMTSCTVTIAAIQSL